MINPRIPKHLVALALAVMCNAGLVHAQAPATGTVETITLSQAIAQALEKNYDLLLAENQAEIERINNHPGNAGLLPSLAVNSSYNYARNNTELEFANDIPPNNTDGAQSRSLQYGLQFNYRLFDGLGSIYSYRQLGNSEKISDLEARIVAESIILQTAELYLNAALAKEQINIAHGNLEVSGDRLKRAQIAQEVGAVNQLELLGAEVDYNRDSITWRNALILYDELRRGLQLMMGHEIQLNFDVETDMKVADNWNASEVQSDALTNNASLLSAAYTIHNAELGIKRAQSARLPVLDATAGYGFTQNNNDVGILLRQQNIGLNAGVTLRWNLFNGGQVNRSIKIAKTALESSELMRDKAQATIDRDVQNALARFDHLRNTWVLEERNSRVAQLNLDRSKEQFNLGVLSATAYREAQVNLFQSKLAVQSAKFDLKMAELELMRLSGRLLTEGS
jgi:outer membrane protein